MEIACRQKKSQEIGGGGASGSGGGSGEGFFYGGYCHMAELHECDSHHNFVQQMPDISSTMSFGESLLGDLQLAPSIDSNRNEAMASQAVNKSMEFLADTRASHHIAHKREFFMDLTPLSRPFNIQQVQGKIAVTHSGTVIMEVDSKHGETALRLTNVLFIESMQFNILFLQQLLAADFIPVFNEITNQVVIKKIISHGGVEQVALLSRSKASRLTLDYIIFSSPPTLLSIPLEHIGKDRCHN